MHLLDPRNGPDWDQPAPAGPPRVYLVASLPRTGSTLLCNALWDTGRAGAPKEYLNPMQRRDWARRRGAFWPGPVRGPALAALAVVPWPERALAAHLREVQLHRSGGGWFGLKLHAHHHAALAGSPGLQALLGAARVVRVQRADRLAQAVSWARARQTGAWAHWQRGVLPPVYSRRAIDEALGRIAAGEAHWDRVLAGREVLCLDYEALAADLGEAVGAVLRLLGVDAEIPPPQPSLRRQADARSAEWIARYRAGA